MFVNHLSSLCSGQIAYEGQFIHIKIMFHILQCLLLTLTIVKLIPLNQLQNYDKNQNQDVKYSEKNFGH